MIEQGPRCLPGAITSHHCDHRRDRTRVESLVSSYLPGSLLAPTANAQSVDGEPFASGAQDLPESVDTDGDGSIDTIEDTLGSDAADAASTPESISIPLSCIDGADNDLDGAVDDQDPRPPAPGVLPRDRGRAGRPRYLSSDLSSAATGDERWPAAAACKSPARPAARWWIRSVTPEGRATRLEPPVVSGSGHQAMVAPRILIRCRCGAH